MIILTLSLLFLTACSSGQAVSLPEETPVLWEDGVDYMEHMIVAAVNGDLAALDAATEARNAMITDLQLEDEMLTTEVFLSEFCRFSGFEIDVDYHAALIECCATGDYERGRVLAEQLSTKNEWLDINEPSINFDDLMLVAKVIYGEAGSHWLSLEWKMKVGEVLLNRVASPEFPDTIAECVYQPGQYGCTKSWRWTDENPTALSAEAALRLMLGERLINDPSVIFQAEFEQGSGVWEKMYDDHYGYTYLCHSAHMQYYD